MDLTAVIKTAIWAVAALIALKMFARPVAAMVNRMRRLGPAEFDQAAQQQVESRPTIQPAGVELVIVAPGTVLAERVDLVRQGINALPEAQRLEQAIRVAGLMGLIANLEWVNSQIYGSQLELLQIMNGRSEVSVAEARAKYDAAAEQSAEQYRTYSFEAWLDWLINRAKVVTRSGDALAISALGRDLLRHIVDRGYSFHRTL